MSTTLSYGYIKPANPDTGDSFFPALAANIQQMNDHAHNGTDSAPLATRTVSVPSASWVLVSGGNYRQAVAIPAGMSYDVCHIWFKLSTNEYVYPSVERISASSFYVYSNDNSLTYTAYLR